MTKILFIISLGIISISPILFDDIPPPPEPHIPEPIIIELPEDLIRSIIRDEVHRIEQETIKASKDAERKHKDKLKYFRA